MGVAAVADAILVQSAWSPARRSPPAWVSCRATLRVCRTSAARVSVWPEMVLCRRCECVTYTGTLRSSGAHRKPSATASEAVPRCGHRELRGAFRNRLLEPDGPAR